MTDFSKQHSARRKERTNCRVVSCSEKPNDSGYCVNHRKYFVKSSVERKESNKPKKKQPENKKWKDKLDSVFSVFIRLRDTNDQGVGNCISSGKRIYYFVDYNGQIMTNCDNGHHYSRRINSTRWDEYNCNAQDSHENRYKEGMKQDYERGIIKKYGQKELESLTARSMKSEKVDSVMMELKYKYYQKRVLELLNQKDWWTFQRSANSLYK